MKTGKAETVWFAGQRACLAAEIAVAYFYRVFVLYWLAAGITVCVFYLYTQWAAASGRLGRATQETYDRHTRGSYRHIAVMCCWSCMLAPPVWLAGLVSRHIRSARRLRQQRQRGEPVVPAESGAWVKATGDESRPH